MSDSDPALMSVTGGTKGYALGVNLTGSDDTLRLIKVNGTILTTVVNCKINWQTTIGSDYPVKIVVERSGEGNWIVSEFRTNGILIGRSYGTDSELFGLAWFGIFYRYSSACDRLLWIDDIIIEGIFHEDITAPEIVGCKAVAKNAIEIILNEPPSVEFMVLNNFSMNSTSDMTVRITKKNAFTFNLEFADVLNNKSINKLIINKICDNSGNCTGNIQIPRGEQIVALFFSWNAPHFFAIDKRVKHYVVYASDTRQVNVLYCQSS